MNQLSVPGINETRAFSVEPNIVGVLTEVHFVLTEHSNVFVKHASF